VLRPVRDRNAFEATVEHLASAVRLGALVNGSRLPPERELAGRLGVSRATLREAIAALRSAGLVATTAGRGGGTVITYAGERTDPKRARALREKAPELHDALDFRRVVEPGAAYLAATRTLDREREDWLRACLAEVSGADSPRSHRVADSRLHLAIATLSESPRLIEAVTDVQAQLHEMLSAIPVLPRNIEHSNQQHTRIVRAVLAGRAPSARSVMEEHCDATSALLRGLLG
jgi:GntR family transcriptional repressor for pyruvate dehydrogenase complex